jgi:hypothetical protein
MTVKIPRSHLGQLLESAAANQEKMTQLLTELEEKATGQKIDKPGLWRQRPKQWWLERVIRPKGSERD